MYYKPSLNQTDLLIYISYYGINLNNLKICPLVES